VCLVACTILAGLISSIVYSCLIIRVCACVWLIMHCLCMFMVACGQVYKDVMMVVVCMKSWCVLLFRSCIDDWTLARIMVAWSYAYVLCFYMMS